jgi:hypothetical protein
MIKDEQWPVARLIPISSASGIEAQERRVASALLAVISAVPEFGRVLLKPFGAPAGKIESFIEVPFKIDGKSIRPDGIIVVTRKERIWGAIVETKVGSAQLDPKQIDAYLDLARELNFDAVLSISNHYVTSSSEYPVDVNRRKLKRVGLYHWSWVNVLTEAVVQKEHRGVSDPDQAYILNELIRYLSDPRSGAVAFDSMGPSWTKVRDGAREQTLRKGDRDIDALAARWDDLIRYLGLELTKELGRDVKQLLAKGERTPAARQSSLRDSLVLDGRLHATLQVPNVAGPLVVMADLRSRQITVSTRFDAPGEGRSKGRVSWLLRQLQNAPDALKVEVRVARTSNTLAANLGSARQSPELLYPEAGREIRQFVISSTRNMGLKRDASKGSFVDSVISTTKDFYSNVLQNLRAWKAPPPKLRNTAEAEPEPAVEERTQDLPPKLGEAIEQAAEGTQEQATGETRHPT